MADSPLSEINWDDLEGQSLISAVNLLQLAFSERVNFAALIGTSTFSGNQRRVLNMFPFFDNSPDVGKTGWPAMWGAHVPKTAWDSVLGNYISETKIANLLLGLPFDALVLRNKDVTLDQDTLLTDLGVTLTGNRATEYPRMDIITTENVKFWYDMITSLKYIFVDSAFGGAGSNGQSRFLSSYSEGIFDGDNSEVVYGGLGPVFGDLPGDWASLWTGPTAKKLISNSSPNFRVSYDYEAAGRAGVRAINTYSRFSTSDFDTIGHSGEPGDIRCYGGYGSNFGGSSWPSDNGYTPNEMVLFPEPSRVDLGGSVIERNIPITAPSIPPHQSNVDFNLRTAHFTFENWDYDGGFTYYTPPPA